jgi:hypothetical protein
MLIRRAIRGEFFGWPKSPGGKPARLLGSIAHRAGKACGGSGGQKPDSLRFSEETGLREAAAPAIAK